MNSATMSHMLRRPATTGFWRGRLPHWEVEDGRYFVTIHLAGAIPKQGEDRIHAISTEHQEKELRTANDAGLPLMRTIFREMEIWLDRAEHHTLLNVPAVAEMVKEAILHRVRINHWHVYEFVIMPNHIHMFLSVQRGTLKESIEDFKRWTGHHAAKLIELPNGRFWQDEWFDHWSRSDEQDERIVRYIRNNPVTAGLVRRYVDWKIRELVRFVRSRSFLPERTVLGRSFLPERTSRLVATCDQITLDWRTTRRRCTDVRLWVCLTAKVLLGKEDLPKSVTAPHAADPVFVLSKRGFGR